MYKLIALPSTSAKTDSLSQQGVRFDDYFNDYVRKLAGQSTLSSFEIVSSFKIYEFWNPKILDLINNRKQLVRNSFILGASLGVAVTGLFILKIYRGITECFAVQKEAFWEAETTAPKNPVLGLLYKDKIMLNAAEKCDQIFKSYGLETYTEADSIPVNKSNNLPALLSGFYADTPMLLVSLATCASFLLTAWAYLFAYRREQDIHKDLVKIKGSSDCVSTNIRKDYYTSRLFSKSEFSFFSLPSPEQVVSVERLTYETPGTVLSSDERKTPEPPLKTGGNQPAKSKKSAAPKGTQGNRSAKVGSKAIPKEESIDDHIDGFLKKHNPLNEIRSVTRLNNGVYAFISIPKKDWEEAYPREQREEAIAALNKGFVARNKGQAGLKYIDSKIGYSLKCLGKAAGDRRGLVGNFSPLKSKVGSTDVWHITLHFDKKAALHLHK